MQELILNKIRFFKFVSVSDKPRLHQQKIITSCRSIVQATLTAEMFSSPPGNTIKEGEIPYLERTNAEPHQLIKHAKIYYSIASLASLVFRKFSY